MAKKKFGPGKCVHCLKEVEARNSDHVFPESWYPDTTQPDVEKWQIPSCIPCNNEYGKLEDDLLTKFGLCLEPSNPASASIVEKALRSVRPAAARNTRDALHRAGRGRRILAQALQGNQIPDHGIFPGLGDRWDDIPGERAAIPIPVRSFERMTEKIVRGIYYVEDSIYIAPPYSIGVYVFPEGDISEWNEPLDKWGKTFAREPGISIRRAVSDDDHLSSLVEITFWMQFKTYAVVSDRP